jgi:hypothetical protein
MSNDYEQVAIVAERIVRYLRIHPEAADTAEGVAQWWLRLQPNADRDDVVAKALKRLMREGAVIQISLNGNTIYRRGRPGVSARRNGHNETLH